MSNRRLALVVAVDTYGDPALHRLAAPAADAAALADVLGDERLGGFEVDVLHNQTSWATAERVERILVDRHPSDLVLLHFSCHGLKDDAGELYLAAGNTRPDLLGSTAVEAAWVNRVMQRSRAQRIVLLLDCCYGGAFERGLISRAGDGIDVGDQFRQRDLGGGRGRVVITASTAMEYAFEGARLTDGAPATPSVFTGALVEGIRTGAADRDQDGYVALGELYDYVYDRVRTESPKQTPSKWEFGMRGGLYVARNPFRRSRPVMLPPELVDLVAHPLAAVRSTAVRELAVIVRGADLQRAAAARLALTGLADDDSRAVSAEAAAVLTETRVRLAAETLDLGEVTVGGAPTVGVVEVRGGPLAAASTAAGGRSVAARLRGSVLRVSWTARTPGELDDVVTLDGPAGTATLHVTGRAVAPTPQPEPQPEPQPASAQPGPAEAGPGSAPEPSRTAVRSGPRSTVGAVLRPRLRPLLAALVALTATAAVAVWADRDREQPEKTGPVPGAAGTSSGPGPVLPSGPRDFTALRLLVPTKEQKTCTEEEPNAPSTATANCSAGFYQFWNTEAEMLEDMRFPESKPGGCHLTPGEETINDSITIAGRTVRMTCGLFKPRDNEPFYFVQWAIDGLLLTGSFYSARKPKPTDYPPVYEQAIEHLYLMPSG